MAGLSGGGGDSYTGGSDSYDESDSETDTTSDDDSGEDETTSSAGGGLDGGGGDSYTGDSDSYDGSDSETDTTSDDDSGADETTSSAGGGLDGGGGDSYTGDADDYDSGDDDGDSSSPSAGGGLDGGGGDSYTGGADDYDSGDDDSDSSSPSAGGGLDGGGGDSYTGGADDYDSGDDDSDSSSPSAGGGLDSGGGDSYTGDPDSFDDGSSGGSSDGSDGDSTQSSDDATDGTSTDPSDGDGSSSGSDNTSVPNETNDPPNQTPPDRASDDAIRREIRESAAAGTDYAAAQYTVTGFEETEDGDLVPEVALRGEQPGDTDGVPEAFRSQIREQGANQLDTVSPDDATVTIDDGEIGITFSESSLAFERRSQAAEQLDEQFPSVDVTAEKVIPSQNGEGFTLNESTVEEIETNRQQFEDQLSDPTPPDDSRQVVDRLEEIDADTRASPDIDTPEPDDTTRGETSGQIQPQSEPGAAATVVGSAFQAVDNSPVGDALEAASEPVFGDLDDRSDGVVGRIDSFLADIEEEYNTRVTEPLQETDPDSVDPQRFNAPRPFGITGEDALGTTVQFAEFTNPGAIGRDFVTIAESGAQAREFFLERGPEGAQIAGETVAAGAEAAPGAARSAAAEVRENPREAARTGAALTATFGAGALASSAARGGATVATRGVRTGASRVDDVLDASGRTQRATRRIDDAVDRAPDVSVRRDPTTGPLDVDPMLGRQLREAVPEVNVRQRVSTGIERVRNINRPQVDSSSDMFGRPERTGAVASRVAERASDLEDQIRTANRPAGDSTSDVFGRPTRTTRPAAVPGESRVGSAVSDATDRLGNLNQPVGTGTAGVFGRPLRGTLPGVSRGEGVLSRLNRANQGNLGSAGVFGRPMTNSFDLGLDRFSVDRRGGTAEVFGRPERTAAVVDRVGQIERPSVLGGLRSLTPDRSVREFASDASDTTLRVGPIRPRRTEIDASDLDIEFDEFGDDVDFGLDDAGSAGGRTDFDADVEVGRGSGSGSDQLSLMRTSRRSETEVDLDSRVRSRQRSAGGPDVRRSGILGGIGVSTAASGSLFPELDDEPITDGFAEVDGTARNDFSPLDDLGATETTGTATATTSTGFGIDTSVTSGTTTTTTPSTTTDLETNQILQPEFGEPPSGGSQSRTPFPGVDPDGDETGAGFGSFEVADDVFDTGVADAGDVLDDIF